MIAPFRIGLIVLLLGSGVLTAHGQSRQHPGYVGSEVCGACHESETSAWRKSHHAKAWMHPNEDTVDGDFDDAEFTHNGRKSRFFRNHDDYFIETTDIVDGPAIFKVVGVGGVTPLQQYLIETEPGRLQSFDVVWDREKRVWYHLYPEQELKLDDGFHWSGPYKNWNGRCAECHATGFEKNYNLKSRKYGSTQAEIGVGCEACHGPGEAHVVWADGAGQESKRTFPGLSEKGLIIDFTASKPDVEIEQCAGCHSRREPFQDFNPIPGTPFHDSYKLALLREGLYHPDGQILDEVYVYGSFLQSNMYDKGVRCSDCHDPHSAELMFQENAVCTQCHSAAGNTEFPSLVHKTYDDPSHHFHEPGTAGTQCIACHMIERTYMGIDGRRDHSFRIPRPDLTEKIGTPNACNDCHQNKSAAWATQELKARFPDSVKRNTHFGETFSSARLGESETGQDLFAIAAQTTFPAIVRATAIDLLARQIDSDVSEDAFVLLNDPDALVRSAALSLVGQVSSPSKIKHMLRALEDPVKAVRIAAAREILALGSLQIPETSRGLMKSANQEWQASLAAKLDFPETHMAIGGAALAMRNLEAAIAAFEEVTELDPQLVQAWLMLVQLHWTRGDIVATEFTIQKALALNPENPNLMDLKDQFVAR